MKASNHPTGIAAVAITVLLIVARQVGLDLSPDLAAGIVGLVAAVVSKLSPRHPASHA